MPPVAITTTLCGRATAGSAHTWGRAARLLLAAATPAVLLVPASLLLSPRSARLTRRRCHLPGGGAVGSTGSSMFSFL